MSQAGAIDAEPQGYEEFSCVDSSLYAEAIGLDRGRGKWSSVYIDSESPLSGGDRVISAMAPLSANGVAEVTIKLADVDEVCHHLLTVTLP